MMEILTDIGFHGGFEIAGLLVIGACLRWKHNPPTDADEQDVT